MIINKATQDIIRVLLNGNTAIKLRDLAKKANVSLGMAVKIVNSLASTQFINKKNGIKVVQYERLLKAWAYTVSVNENPKIEFIAAERPQYLIKKISNLLKNEKYAFTLFSATEVTFPYVTPNKVHLYILKTKEKEISKIFISEAVTPAEEGNVICYLVDESHLFGSLEIRGIKIISLPQLYVDLISYGGRGQEAAEQILNLLE